MTQVLLVDDDIELGEMLTEYLEREGFGATAVSDGETGVAEAPGEYGIVVLDVMMPRRTASKPCDAFGRATAAFRC